MKAAVFHFRFAYQQCRRFPFRSCLRGKSFHFHFVGKARKEALVDSAIVSHPRRIIPPNTQPTSFFCLARFGIFSSLVVVVGCTRIRFQFTRFLDEKSCAESHTVLGASDEIIFSFLFFFGNIWLKILETLEFALWPFAANVNDTSTVCFFLLMSRVASCHCVQTRLTV